MYTPHRNYVKLLFLAGYSKEDVNSYCKIRYFNDIREEYDIIYEECIMIPNAREMMLKNSEFNGELFIDDMVMGYFCYKEVAHDLMQFARQVRGFKRRHKDSKSVIRLLENINERQLVECAIMVGMSPQKIITAMKNFTATRKSSFPKLPVLSAFSYYFWHYPINEKEVYYNAFDVGEYIKLRKDAGNWFYDYHSHVLYGNEQEVKCLFGLMTSDDRRQQISMLSGKLFTYLGKNVGKSVADWHVPVFIKLLDYQKESEDSESGPAAQRRHMESIFTRITVFQDGFPTLDELDGIEASKYTLIGERKKEPEQDEQYELTRQDNL